jgi:hypothetical protein
MSVIKKADVPAHFAARRARRRAGALFTSRPVASSVSKAAGAKADAQAIVEDSSLEHSSLTEPAIRNADPQF